MKSILILRSIISLALFAIGTQIFHFDICAIVYGAFVVFFFMVLDRGMR